MAATKDRILDVTADLLRRQGYTATGLKQIVGAADAPFGSVYHFFPGGKEQLGAEALRRSGVFYLQIWERILDSAPDVVIGVHTFFAGAARTLRESDYADACPIATVALEVASTSEPLREATADVFESWIAAAAQRFSDAGIPSDTARDLAISVLSVLEGAFIFCRAMRNTRPMEIAGATAVATVEAALSASRENPALPA